MTRTLLAVGTAALVALLALLPAGAAPAPKVKRAFVPTATEVGTRWVYVRNEDEADTSVEEVTERTAADGVQTLTVLLQFTKAGNEYRDVYQLTDRGEFTLTETRGIVLATPMVLWQAGVRPGEGWDKPYAYRVGQEFGLLQTVGEPKELTTPAGKFFAYPVERKYTKPAMAATTFWFADGVGVVREESAGRLRQELKEFRVGPAMK